MTKPEDATTPAVGSLLDRGVGRPAIEGTQASRERPILFSAPMVRALLDGSKTQTRREVKPSRFVQFTRDAIKMTGDPARLPCPYGNPGDRLWVRETWAARHEYDGHKPAHIPALARWHYAATEDRGGLLWRPSIHMPRWACRITLVVTGVRAERLHDISRCDAMAEGCPFPNMARGEDPRVWYEDLWCDLNGVDSWRANPWVWVVEFRKTPNVRANLTTGAADEA